MNPVSTNQKFRKILFWLTTIFIAIHISVGSLHIFYTIDFLPSKLKSLYEKLLILGPFFVDKRITTSPHLYISHSSPTGDWLPFHDYAQENLLDFQRSPWRYDKLKLAYYDRYLSRKVYEEMRSLQYVEGKKGWASLELIKYANTLHRPQSDSIRFLYFWNTWMPADQVVKIDTAFNVAFKVK